MPSNLAIQSAIPRSSFLRPTIELASDEWRDYWDLHHGREAVYIEVVVMTRNSLKNIIYITQHLWTPTASHTITLHKVQEEVDLGQQD